MERKQLILIGSIVGGLAVVGVIVAVIFLRIRATQDLIPITTTDTPSGPAVQVQVGDGQMDSEKSRLAEQELQRLSERPKDSDGDGLSDEQEASLGTNPEEGDTDHDGWNDAEEVNIHKTDPKTPDPSGFEQRVQEVQKRTGTTSTRPIPAPTPTPSPVPTPNAPSPDIDGDGLTAEQEATLGTDSNNPDTDGDGLTDRQEAETYKTDPLKADTDGDTFPDGSEVQSGYNPLGPGKCARETCIP